MGKIKDKIIDNANSIQEAEEVKMVDLMAKEHYKMGGSNMTGNYCCGEPMKVCGSFVVGGVEEDILECDFCGKRTDQEKD